MLELGLTRQQHDGLILDRDFNSAVYAFPDFETVSHISTVTAHIHVYRLHLRAEFAYEFRIARYTSR